MDFLSDILEKKRARLETARAGRPLAEVRVAALEVRSQSGRHRLREALSRLNRINIIAEVKRASPSKGAIRGDVDPMAIARTYEVGGAAAISVLTEEDRFCGSLDDLRAVRSAVSIPVLRKDFIFDEYQLYEAAAAGADGLLLIVAALNDESLSRLRAITEDELGMDALVEVHDADELKRALSCGARVIGVNNRNLRSFEVSLDVSRDLASHFPNDVLRISESGLSLGADISSLRSIGYDGFLIGEALMRADDPGSELRNLIEQAQAVAV
jgi:indole-3-glycerol phosphate synthase